MQRREKEISELICGYSMHNLGSERVGDHVEILVNSNDYHDFVRVGFAGMWRIAMTAILALAFGGAGVASIIRRPQS